MPRCSSIRLYRTNEVSRYFLEMIIVLTWLFKQGAPLNVSSLHVPLWHLPVQLRGAWYLGTPRRVIVVL